MTQTDRRDPDAIERDIRQTQEDMSDTVNRIGDQMTPRRLFDALLEKAEANGIDARYILDGARRNPLALGLMSAGAIWLLSDYDAKPGAFKGSDRSDHKNDNDDDRDHRQYVEHMSRIERRPDEDDLTYGQRRDEHRGAYFMIEREHEEDHSSYRQRLNDATTRLREKRDNFTEGARTTRQNIAGSTRNAARKGRDAYDRNPLVGGLAAAIVGAIAGSVLPTSQAERQKLGAQGAKAIDTAREQLGQVGEQVRKSKDEAVELAKSRIDEHSTA